MEHVSKILDAGKGLPALPPTETRAVDSWSGAATRGLEARREREQIIKKVLVPGADFGVIPGTEKPTLLKPGAEKIIDSLNLWPDYVCESSVEDWDKPLFFYRYRCILRSRGSDVAIASGIGSCNSMEDRYRWRRASRICPKCNTTAIIAGKKEYGGGWLCFKKKGGCGAKFVESDPKITSQPEGRVENDDVFSQVNTIDKMAQKRALVAASLDLGFSEHFTQDMEDAAREPESPEGDPTSETGPEPPPPPPQGSGAPWDKYSNEKPAASASGGESGIEPSTWWRPATPAVEPDKLRAALSQIPDNPVLEDCRNFLARLVEYWPEGMRDRVIQAASFYTDKNGKTHAIKHLADLTTKIDRGNYAGQWTVSDKWAATTLSKLVARSWEAVKE